MEMLRGVCRIRNLSSTKRDFTVGRVICKQSGPTQKPTQRSPAHSGDVPGLSNAVLKVSNEPVGPGASKNTNYKNPEYFCYDKSSFFEAEIEMLKFRCPQPSNKKHFAQ